MINAKKKGNAGEHKLSHWLQENGIKAYRNSMSGGSIWKGDIGNNIDMTIECKTVKKLNLQEAFRQVKRDAELASNTPLLAIHFDGMPDNKWLMVMDSDSWLEAVKAPKIETVDTNDDRKLKWALNGLKMALNNVLKYL